MEHSCNYCGGRRIGISRLSMLQNEFNQNRTGLHVTLSQKARDTEKEMKEKKRRGHAMAKRLYPEDINVLA